MKPSTLNQLNQYKDEVLCTCCSPEISEDTDIPGRVVHTSTRDNRVFIVATRYEWDNDFFAVNDKTLKYVEKALSNHPNGSVVKANNVHGNPPCESTSILDMSIKDNGKVRLMTDQEYVDEIIRTREKTISNRNFTAKTITIKETK